MGTDGGCFGLIAALTLGTAAGGNGAGPGRAEGWRGWTCRQKYEILGSVESIYNIFITFICLTPWKMMIPIPPHFFFVFWILGSYEHNLLRSSCEKLWFITCITDEAKEIIRRPFFPQDFLLSRIQKTNHEIWRCIWMYLVEREILDIFLFCRWLNLGGAGFLCAFEAPDRCCPCSTWWAASTALAKHWEAGKKLVVWSGGGCVTTKTC